MSPETDAIARCRETLARGSKSFALASHLLPQPARDRAAVVYAYCRRADDAIDDAPSSSQPAALERLRAELRDIYGGRRPSEITLAAFQDVAQQTRIPSLYPEELLNGMEMDVRGTEYRTLDDLLLYCFRVASTVGLMMCHVMGLYDQRALHNAAHLGIAMQLTNICRDVAEDWTMGRLYIPREILDQVGCGPLDPSASPHGGVIPKSARRPLSRAVEILLRKADAYYRSGDRGLRALHWRCALAIRAARLIYAAIGERIAGRRFDVASGRAVVPLRDKLKLVTRAAGAELGGAPGRVGRWVSNADRRHRSPFGPGYLPDTVVEPGDVLRL